MTTNKILPFDLRPDSDRKTFVKGANIQYKAADKSMDEKFDEVELAIAQNLDRVVYSEISADHTVDPRYKINIVRVQGTNDVNVTLPNIQNMKPGSRVYVHVVVQGTHEATIYGSNGQQVVGGSSYGVEADSWALFIADADTMGWQLASFAKSVKDGDTGITGLNFDDGSTDVAGITKVNLKGAKITELPNTGSMGPGEISMTFGPSIHMMSPNQQYGLGIVDEIIVEPPLNVYDDPSSTNEFALRWGIQHGYFELKHPDAFLGKVGKPISIKSGTDTIIYPDDSIMPDGEFIYRDPAGQGIFIQDTVDIDPNLTPGEPTELMASVYLEGKAPMDGMVTVWFEYKQLGAAIPTGKLRDSNGKMLIRAKHFNAGDDLGLMVLAGFKLAKGIETITFHVEHDFLGEQLVVDPDKTLFCVTQMPNSNEESLARISFQRRLGISIIPEVRHIEKQMVSLADCMKGITFQETDVEAGVDAGQLNFFSFPTLTKAKASVLDGVITVKDNGTDMADFNALSVVDAVQTYMLRGKDMSASITVSLSDNSARFELYVWKGAPDQYTPIYTTRVNGGDIVVATGWTLVKSESLSEIAGGTYQGKALNATVPEDANNIAFIVYLGDKQLPNTLSMKEFEYGPDIGFVGYMDGMQQNLHESHLIESEAYAEYILNNKGYVSDRYTISAKKQGEEGQPMPFGYLIKGKAKVEADRTVNQVSGSDTPQFDGAIKFTVDGDAKISKSYLVFNEQSTDSTVTFLDVLINGDGTESLIFGSEKSFTIPAHTTEHGIEVTIPAYGVQVESGQRVAGKAYASKDDGAYIMTSAANQFAVQTTIDFTELTLESGDDPEASLDVTRQAREQAGDTIYTATLRGTAEFASASSADIVFTDLPVDSVPHVVKAYKKNPDGSVESVARLEEIFDPATSTLTVAFGESAETKVLYEVWV